MRFVALSFLLFFQTDGFTPWFAQFQSALAKNEVQAVAKGIRWPMQWENGPVRDIKTEADLAKRFDSYFTPEIRQQVARGKPQRFEPGAYGITWKARGNEYSLYFTLRGGKWVLDGLSEGPP